MMLPPLILLLFVMVAMAVRLVDMAAFNNMSGHMRGLWANPTVPSCKNGGARCGNRLRFRCTPTEAETQKTMSRYDDEDGDTVLDDRLSDYDGDEERPHLTSGEAAAIREVEKNSRKIQTLFLVVTFFGSLLISTVKWYSRPRGAGPVYDGLWDIFGTGYTDKQNQMRLNRTLAYLLAANISGHDGWLPTDEEGTGTLLDLYDSTFSPQYQASVWISTVDHRRLNIPDAEAVSSINEYLFVQRYVLAVLFFATGGLKNWAYSLMFLSGSHECDWFDLFEVKGMPLGMGLTFGIGCDKDPQTYVGEDWQKERIVTHIVMLRKFQAS